ncbi:MAG: hemerythrin domain-containing protein [Sulfuritalea sp.]|jgi:iron-sulfur cluster repair protein YtfE (RIC family)|nr:hemerythrin domain-containing protein [Sulfuritalea sp.]MDP1984248.1 hemerythrin domain-containing protein [Sulfuritalea sp.]
MSITDPLHQHHKHCDRIFADAEDACASGDWIAGDNAFTLLHDQLETHFSSEEELLFPAFEAATGMTSGPTEVMRGEHRQMRELLAQMREALTARDGDAFGGAAETLLILMQQHNMKEENILYPMCDNALGSSDVGALLAHRLRAS